MAESRKRLSLRLPSLRSAGRKGQEFFRRATGLGGGAPAKGSPAGFPRGEHHLPAVTGHITVGSVARSSLAILGILAGILLIVILNRVIILLMLAVFIAAIIDPGVRWLRRYGVPQSLAILLHYAVFLSLGAYLLLSLLPVIAKQVGEIAVLANAEVQRLLTERTVELPFMSHATNVQLTAMLRTTLHNMDIGNFPDALEKLSENIATAASGSLQFAAQLARSAMLFLFDAFIVLLFAFFIQMERDRNYRWIKQFIPGKYWAYMDARLEMIDQKLGQWMRGQILLCLCIGLMVFVTLTILRVPYALTLALLAGFTEFIPYLGPIIGAIPAILIATVSGGVGWGLVVFGVYYVVQMLENNFIVPLIMKNAVDMPAVAIMVAMLIGISFPAVLHPVLGILISIPLASVIGIFLEDLRAWHISRSDKA